MKKNVLVTGIGQANYVLRLYENLRPKLSDFSFSILNLRVFGDIKAENKASHVFEKMYRQRPNHKNFKVFITAIIPVILNKYFWKDFRICIGEKGWNFFKNGFFLIFSRHINAYHYALFIDDKTKTDVIHVHFPVHMYALFLKYLKKDYEIIFTYWGSDIYRIDSWRDHEFQGSSLKDTKLITCTTPEMEFLILSRFGFYLKPKLRNAYFILEDNYYHIADKLMDDKNWIPQYKQSLGIGLDKTIILFGHNAKMENNHIEFIQVLESLPKEIGKSWHIIFPLTYGDDPGEYISSITRQAQGLPSSFSIMTDFLDWEELAKMKIISDVYIHCPTTDGLSAFLTEFFYTNNLAIVGSWLPYKTFSNFKIEYLEFEDFPELKEVLLNLPEHLLAYNSRTQANKRLVAENFSTEAITQDWMEIFNELKA